MASSYGEDAGKTALRTQYLCTREQMPAQTRYLSDSAVRERLWSFSFYKSANTILVYDPYDNDLDISSIVQHAEVQGKSVYVSKGELKRGMLQFVKADELHDENALPISAQEMVGSICLVPALCFDADGYRVDYDEGPIDHFLAFYPGDKVGLARTMQLSSNPLPRDGANIACDIIVSEDIIWWCA